MLKQRWGLEKIGGLHVLFTASDRIKVGVACDSMDPRERPTADRSIVRVGDGRHDTFHSLVETLLLPASQRGHVAILEVIGTEAVKHDHHCSLRFRFTRTAEAAPGSDRTATGKG